jgi:hypothetical protein
MFAGLEPTAEDAPFAADFSILGTRFGRISGTAYWADFLSRTIC